MDYNAPLLCYVGRFGCPLGIPTHPYDEMNCECMKGVRVLCDTLARVKWKKESGRPVS